MYSHGIWSLSENKIIIPRLTGWGGDDVEIMERQKSLQREINCKNSWENSPVITIDVIQPAALLHDFNWSRNVLPRGKAVSPLILVTVAGLDPAAVGLVLLPVGVVVDALLCFWPAQDGTCRDGKHNSMEFCRIRHVKKCRLCKNIIYCTYQCALCPPFFTKRENTQSSAAFQVLKHKTKIFCEVKQWLA